MDLSSILMCVDIPEDISEDVLCELFCVAGPIEEVTIGKSGQSCFIVYQFKDAVTTAKEIFQDLYLKGKPIQLFDHNDIQEIYENQKNEVRAPNPNSYHRHRGNSHHRNQEPQYSGFFRNDMLPRRNEFSGPFNGSASHNYHHSPNYNNLLPRRGTPQSRSKSDSQQVEFNNLQSPYTQPVSRANHKRFGHEDDVNVYDMCPPGTVDYRGQGKSGSHPLDFGELQAPYAQPVSKSGRNRFCSEDERSDIFDMPPPPGAAGFNRSTKYEDSNKYDYSGSSRGKRQNQDRPYGKYDKRQKHDDYSYESRKPSWRKHTDNPFPKDHGSPSKHKHFDGSHNRGNKHDYRNHSRKPYYDGNRRNYG